MCYTILKELPPEEEVLGYKVAVQNIKSGRYYSAFVGNPIKIGKVGIKRKQRILSEAVSGNLMDTGFREHAVGRCACYSSKADATDMYTLLSARATARGYRLTMLEMCMTEAVIGDVPQKFRRRVLVVAGRKITRFTEIQERE
jgi:hypothetical protein